MKKLFTFLFAVAIISFCSLSTLAQSPLPYTYTQAVVGYTPLVGGTSFQSGTAINTNTISSAITIPFTFTFNGVGYTSIFISNNGFITFGVTPPLAATVSPISVTTAYDGAIAAYGFNLVASTVSGATPDISYGSAGSDFVVQFTDVARTGITGDRMSFQIRLTQTTNVVKIVYNNWAATTTTTSVANFGQVGMRGLTNTAFLNRMVYPTAPYNTWLTSGGGADNGATPLQAISTSGPGGPNCMRYNNSYLPGNGLTYTYTPVAAGFYQVLPYTQNFESWSNLQSVNDVPGTGVISNPAAGNQSIRAHNETLANTVWGSTSGGTIAVPGAGQGTKCARLHSYDMTSGLKGYLDFYVNFTTAGSKQMTFDLINTASTRPVKVYLSTNGGVTFGAALATFNSSLAAWTNVGPVALGSSTSSTCVVRIEMQADFASSSDVGLDNVNISLIPACVTPISVAAGSITATTASISWTCTGCTGTYELDYGSYGHAAGSGNIIAGVTSPFTLNPPLSQNTAYTVYIRQDCSGGGNGFSSWSSGANFTTLEACPTPTGLAAGSITATTASISWICTGCTGTFELDYGANPHTAGTGTIITTGVTSPYLLNPPLTPSTGYQVFVRQNCTGGGNGYSNWSTGATFTTLVPPPVNDICSGAIVIPPAGPFPYTTGVTNNTNATNTNDPTNTCQANSNKGVWYTYTPTTTGSYIISSCQSDAASSAISDNVLSIFTSSGGCAGPFTQVACDDDACTTLGAQAIITTTLTSGTQYYILAYGYSTGVGNIQLKITAPQLCPIPTVLAAGSITSTTASISWTCTGCTGTFELDYGANPHTAGTGTIITTGVTSPYLLNPPLTPSTGYQIFVRQNCSGSGNGNSDWSTGATFTTLAPPPVCPGGLGVNSVSVGSLPYSTSGQTTCGSGNNVTSTNVVSACGSSNYYGAEDRTYIFTPTTTGVHTILLTTATDDDAGIMLYQGCPFTAGSSCVANAQSTTGLTRTLTPTLTSGVTYYLVVDNWPSPACIGTYSLAIDPPPTCPAPTGLSATNFTTSGADLGWTSPSSFFDLFIELSGGPTPGIGTTPTVDNNAGNSYTWTGGNPSTSYVFYVRADCGGGDVSTWAGPYTIKTLCNAINLPFTEDFESMTTDFNCWSVMGNTAAQGGLNGSNLVTRTGNTWGVCTPSSFSGAGATYIHSGIRSAALGYTAPDFNWLISSDINMPSSGNVNLKFWIWYLSNTSYTSKFYVNVLAEGAWNTVLTYNAISNTNQYTTEVVVPLDAYIGKVIKVAFIFEYNDGYEMAIDDISIKAVPLNTTWTGAVNSNWDNAGNWNPDVPGPNTDVIIPFISGSSPNYPTLTAARSCHNFTIQSSASGTGSILDNGFLSVSGTSIVERFMPSSAWHLISSPVTGVESGIFSGKFLQKHSESTNVYTDIKILTEPLTPMKGFALWGGDVLPGFTAAYTGPLNTGNYGTIDNLTRSGPDAPPVYNYGWNLVGNPYPSSINWSAASGWTKTNLNNAVYIENSSSWASFVGGVGTPATFTGTIAPGQGFFVQVSNGGTYPIAGTLQMTNAVRVHSNATFYKEAVANLVRLQVSGNSYTDEAVVRFLPQATAGFDGEFDAHKLFGYVDEAAQLYTLGNSPLVINTLPETSTVAVGIKTGTDGIYTISATEVNDLQAVSLEDTQTGVFTDLLKTSYTFSINPCENNQRFVLHFGPLSVDEIENSFANIYSYSRTVYVDLKNNVKGDIFIYNISGQLIASVPEAVGSKRVNISNTGNYIVKVITNQSTLVKKVFIE